MSDREGDDYGYPGFERRRTPHRYDLYDHFDTKIEGIEKRLAAIEAKFEQASFAARLLRWSFTAAAVAWGLIVWAKDHVRL